MPGESKRNSSKMQRRTRRVRRLKPMPSVQRKAFLKELEKKIVKNKITYEEMVTINGCFNNCIRKKNVGGLEVIPDVSQRQYSTSVRDNILNRYTGNSIEWRPDIKSNNYMLYSLLAKNRKQQKISNAFDLENPDSPINQLQRRNIMSLYNHGKGKKKSKKKGKKKDKKKDNKSKKGGRRIRNTKKKSNKGKKITVKQRKKRM